MPATEKHFWMVLEARKTEVDQGPGRTFQNYIT
jgi:hypothetical protein